jgi:tetratricopeptide (TPR) repeat protein
MRIAVRFGPACFTLLSLLAFFLRVKDMIPAWLFVVLMILNFPLSAAGVLGIYWATSQASEGLVRRLLAAEDIPPARTYPNQDLLIAQGRHAEAADYFRDHLTVDPEDNQARLRLAELLETRLADLDGAERVYLEVRRRRPTPREELAATNGLIDVYRKAGRRDRLKVELARFADRYRGTAAGEAAARELKALKAEDSAAGA